MRGIHVSTEILKTGGLEEPSVDSCGGEQSMSQKEMDTRGFTSLKNWENTSICKQVWENQVIIIIFISNTKDTVWYYHK